MIQTCMETGTLRYLGFLFLHGVNLFFHADGCQIGLKLQSLALFEVAAPSPRQLYFLLFSTN